MFWFTNPREKRLRNMTPEQLLEEEQRSVRYAAEQLSRAPSKVEVFARAYCKELGYNPDGQWLPGPMMLAQPRWKKYRDIAEAVLHQQAKEAGLAALLNDTDNS